MATPLQRGENVDYTPIADVAAGAVVKLGSNFYGVALSPIPANTLGALAVVGAFRFTASAAIAYGALLYYDSSTDKVSSVAVNGNYIGRSINVAAADGDESWGLLDAVNIG